MASGLRQGERVTAGQGWSRLPPPGSSPDFELAASPAAQAPLGAWAQGTEAARTRAPVPGQGGTGRHPG